MPAQRIGVLGGTFDPIHFGHLGIAAAVADARQLDLVIFVPAGTPWHRRAMPTASGDDRCAMVALAMAADHRFILSRVDVDRAGPTYTVDTLRDLREWADLAHPGIDVEWTLIIGADALMEMHTWREPEEIARLAQVVGVTRPGHAIGVPHLPVGRWSTVAIGGIDISSTEVRRRLAARDSVADLVPESVIDYIEARGLYGITSA